MSNRQGAREAGSLWTSKNRNLATLLDWIVSRARAHGVGESRRRSRVATGEDGEDVHRKGGLSAVCDCSLPPLNSEGINCKINLLAPCNNIVLDMATPRDFWLVLLLLVGNAWLHS